MIFPLVQDFTDALAAMPREHLRYRILKLLDEAIRRDVHFIDRHPTTFFQCMWNTCWWYDCPEAAEQFSPGTWQQPDTRLHEIVESWRDRKLQATPGFTWVRSQRAPELALGVGLHAIIPDMPARNRWTAPSFGSNGRVATFGDGRVTIADLGTGAKVRSFQLPSQTVDDGTFFDRGRHILCVDRKEVSVWDAETGTMIMSGIGPPPYFAVEDYAYDYSRIFPTNAGLRILTTTSESFQIWNPVKGESIFLRRKQVGQHVLALARDGRRLAIADDSHGQSSYPIRILDIQTGTQYPACIGHTDGVEFATFAATERFLMSAGTDRTLRCWATDSGRQLACIEAHEGAINAMAYSSRRQFVATASVDKMVRIWDFAKRQLKCCLSMDNSITCVAWLDDGRWLAVCSGDRLFIWDADNLAPTTPPIGHRIEQYSSSGPRGNVYRQLTISLSADGRRLSTTDALGVTLEWDLATGRPMPASGNEHSLSTMRPNHDARYSWQAVDGVSEMTLSDTKSQTMLAWFPALLNQRVGHPTRPAWAGATDNRVYFVALEPEFEMSADPDYDEATT